MSQDHDSAHHIIPIKTYLYVFTALIILTVLTVTSAAQDFGTMNIVIAIVIASIKASLVFLWFMHLKYDELVNRVIILVSLFMVALLGVFTAGDIWSRVVSWFV